jgi:hypothetical protein
MSFPLSASNPTVLEIAREVAANIVYLAKHSRPERAGHLSLFACKSILGPRDVSLVDIFPGLLLLKRSRDDHSIFGHNQVRAVAAVG